MFVRHVYGENPGVKQWQMRGSDSSLRFALMVQAYRWFGLTVEQACDKVAKTPLAKTRLGCSRRGRPAPWRDGTTMLDETVKSLYFAFRKGCPNIDKLLDNWVGVYLHWCMWAMSAPESVIEFVARRYPGSRRTRSRTHVREFYEEN
jgi:hypothetical protein